MTLDELETTEFKADVRKCKIAALSCRLWCSYSAWQHGCLFCQAGQANTQWEFTWAYQHRVFSSRSERKKLNYSSHWQRKEDEGELTQGRSRSQKKTEELEPVKIRTAKQQQQHVFPANPPKNCANKVPLGGPPRARSFIVGSRTWRGRKPGI